VVPTHRQLVVRGLAFAALLTVLFAQLLAVNVRTSMSWDEGHHLFDGYTILKHHNFGLNPEVLPLAKAAAAVPLLPLHLYEPVQQGRSSQLEAFVMEESFCSRTMPTSFCSEGVLSSRCSRWLWLYWCFWLVKRYSAPPLDCWRLRFSHLIPPFLLTVR
jgi:hypothetical protein